MDSPYIYISQARKSSAGCAVPLSWLAQLNEPDQSPKRSSDSDRRPALWLLDSEGFDDPTDGTLSF